DTSIELLLEFDWQARIAQIESKLATLLAPCQDLTQVAEVRCLGAIAVIEMKQPVDMAAMVPRFVEAGIWVRPFGKLVYLMPSYIISDDELQELCESLVSIVAEQAG
ncbi:MAG: aminotransferase class III-fold pyridoxal phosphate-dependent enzyme, partial [Gammaproteobacteria bacterium]|nr:aminotransferase class III-fold pyridoxal phosphate-dependent enzyme [Gammaproteobacteria bacterium]